MPTKKTRKATSKKTSKNNKKTKQLVKGYTNKSVMIVSLLLFAVIGTVLIAFSSAASSGIPASDSITPRRSDKQAILNKVGPKLSECPNGLRQLGSQTITQEGATLECFEIKNGAVKVVADNVTIRNCRVTLGTRTNVSPDANLSSTALAAIYNSQYSGPTYSSGLTVEQCSLHVEYPHGGSTIKGNKDNVFRKNKITAWNADAITLEHGSVYEDNFVESIRDPGACNFCHTDAMQASDWGRSNMTIRRNYFTAPNNPNGGGASSVLQMGDKPAGGRYGSPVYNNVLIENNYMEGGAITARVMGTDQSAPSILRNNRFGPTSLVQYTDIRAGGGYYGNTEVYGNVRDATGQDMPAPNVPTGSSDVTPTPDPSPSPPATPDPEPEPNPAPTPTPTPEPIPTPDTTLPAQFDFSDSFVGWEPQGNSTVAYSAAEGRAQDGALQVKVDPTGPWPDSSRTARAGTTQFAQGFVIGPEKTINARFFVKAQDQNRNVRCELRFYNGNRILQTAKGTSSVTSNSWKERSCTAKAPSNTQTVALRIFINDASYGEVFYLDDIVISEESLPPVASPQPQPQPAPEPAPDPQPTPTPKDSQAPSDPDNLSRKLVFNWTRFRYEVQLSWSASTDNVGVTDYIVKRDGEEIGTSNTTSFSDAGISANNNYSYTVQAQDAAGNVSSPVSTSAQGSCFLFWCYLR